MDWPLLEGVADEDRTRVLSAAVRRRFARNEVVFHDGDPGDTLHLLAKGRVAVRVTTPLGDVALLAVLGAGEVFGEQALISAGARRAGTVIALEPVETLALVRAQFDGLRRRHPSVDRFLVRVLEERLARVSARLLEALYLPADVRVLRRVGELADLYGDGRLPTVVPMTQENLAAMAGTTRSTVNRVLRAAEKRGAVALRRGSTEIVAPDLLRRLAR